MSLGVGNSPEVTKWLLFCACAGISHLVRYRQLGNGLHGQYAYHGRQCVGVDVCDALYLFVSSPAYDVENGVEILGEKTGSI